MEFGPKVPKTGEMMLLMLFMLIPMLTKSVKKRGELLIMLIMLTSGGNIWVGGVGLGISTPKLNMINIMPLF